MADERIKGIRTTDDELIVALADGRTLSVPLVWYPRLLEASAEQRRDWHLIGDGHGVHWPQIDEDLSAEGLLRGIPAPAVRPHSSPTTETGTRTGAAHEAVQTGTRAGERDHVEVRRISSESKMARYMTLFHYTPEAVGAIKGTGEDRSQPVRDLMQQAGGELIDFYYTFGEYDGVFIFEVPDDATAQAAIMAFVAAGHVDHERTINLRTVEEKQEVLAKAGNFHYAPPQASRAVQQSV